MMILDSNGAEEIILGRTPRRLTRFFQVQSRGKVQEVKYLSGVQRMEELMTAKNGAIRQLQYDITKVSKAHNDLIRVYEAKLEEFGIPAEEMGFRPLFTHTTAGPAGLVVGA